jgi:hypothetical protein
VRNDARFARPTRCAGNGIFLAPVRLLGKSAGASMKLREALNVIRSWPPIWRGVGRNSKLLHGEVGVLADVYTKPVESAIFVVIRKCSHKFTGVIFLKDYSLKTRVLSLLEANVGRPIKDIGDLEF